MTRPALDVATGKLTPDDGIPIGPDLTRAQFLASPLASTARPLVENGPHGSWAIAVRLGGRSVQVGLWFEDEGLGMVTLALDDPAFGRDWSEWTREREQARKAAHEAWLASVDPSIGEGRSYPWGFVASVYDEKSGGSEIVLRYGAALPERYVSPYPAIDFGRGGGA